MYKFDPPPTDIGDDLQTVAQAILQYVQDELIKVEQAGDKVAEVRFDVRDVEPEKRRDGMVAFADGTNWNPGAGRGLYVRTGGAWVKL